MENGRRKNAGLIAFLASVAAMVCAAVAPSPSFAADAYPSRHITMVLPFPAGTVTDMTLRLIADHLGRAFGAPVVVDNKGGAGGMIGAATVARAQPNGYTLLFTTNSTHSVVKSLFKSVPYDPERDFAPVARVVNLASMLVVNPALPINTPADFVAYAKRNPGKIRYGYGNSSGLIGGEMLKQAAGIDIMPVAYKGNPQALTDLVSGNIEAMVIDLNNGIPQLKAGKIRAIGVLPAKRNSALPAVPTLNETVAPGLDVSAWGGIFAPAGTPREIVMRLADEIAKFAARPDIKEKLLTVGVELDYAGPDEFAAFLKVEQTHWTEMAKAAGIKPQ